LFQVGREVPLLRYGGARSKAKVQLIDGDGWLTFVMKDDGGINPAGTPLGTSLQGMRDRLDAPGGSLDISSQPAEGTILKGRIPARVSEGGGAGADG
jgi:signal transduction histidine kinase